MHKKFDYTTRARAFALRFPKLNHIAIQVNFWILAFLFLSLIIHLNSLSLASSYTIEIPASLAPTILSAIIMGLLFGTILGFVDIFFERGHLQKHCLGSALILKSIIYFSILIGITSFMKYVLWEMFIIPHYYQDLLPTMNKITWKYFFFILMIYTLVMSAVISFINQMNKKFGPGVLVPMLLGKYRNPREEERIFMFMDLKSSTSYAEKLGHIKYSALIRDSFMDINLVLSRHNAEVYQYVGDEIVVSWPVTSDIKAVACVDFFFACQAQFSKRHDYYLDNYGFVPQFKAGLHVGKVTAVEVGEIKRDIAYHGDTMNTASRIQSVCNDYDKIFLVSGDIKDFMELDKNYSVELLGDISLKGKETPVGVYSVEGKKS